MNDLLNEDDFLPKEYNPNPWFRKFYAGALIYEVVSITIFRFIHIENQTLSIALGIALGLILPMTVAMTMVFAKKEILLDTKKTIIVRGILMLMACFYIPRTIEMAYNLFNIYLLEGVSYEYKMLLVPLISCIVLFLVTLGITLPLVNRSRKIKNIKQ